MSTNAPVTITNTGSAYEATRDGLSVGFLRYVSTPVYVDAVSTQVDPATRGQGIAGLLVQALVDDALAQGTKIKPTCSYVERWLDKHPDLDATLRYA